MENDEEVWKWTAVCELGFVASGMIIFMKDATHIKETAGMKLMIVTNMKVQ